VITAEAPLVSVVIPTHNSARFVAQAVRGVFEQTYGRHEVIVIDDGSSDETLDILQPFLGQIIYCHQGQQGPAAARNAGIRIARGKYVCFLDADDQWSPRS
jgi:glycosyltransferase involved in cell wall biosynthesis